MIDAVGLGFDLDHVATVALDPVGVGLVAVAVAVQAFKAGLFDFVHRQVSVQCGGEAEFAVAAVADLQLKVEAVVFDQHAELGFEGVWPQRARGSAVAESEADEGEILAVALGQHGPLGGARKAVLHQRPEVGELRKAHRDAAADGLAAVVRGERAEVQTLAASRRRPRQHLAAEQAEHRAGAVGDAQAQRRDALELDMFDAGDGHRAQSCKASTPSFTVLSSGSLLSTKPSFCTNLSMRSLFDRNTPFM